MARLNKLTTIDLAEFKSANPSAHKKSDSTFSAIKTSIINYAIGISHSSLTSYPPRLITRGDQNKRGNLKEKREKMASYDSELRF